MNITNRLTPLIERYNELAREEFRDDTMMDVAARTVEDMGFFSIPMLEDLLSEAKRRANAILIDDVPALLAEYGLSEAVLTDGTEVGKELFTEVSQAGSDKNVLMDWLDSNGYSSTVKDTLSFDKGTFKDEIEKFLQKKGYSYVRDSSIHSQTLKKVIKDHIAAGGAMPPENAVKVSMFERAVIKAPKKGRDF